MNYFGSRFLYPCVSRRQISIRWNINGKFICIDLPLFDCFPIVGSTLLRSAIMTKPINDWNLINNFSFTQTTFYDFWRLLFFSSFYFNFTFFIISFHLRFVFFIASKFFCSSLRQWRRFRSSKLLAPFCFHAFRWYKKNWKWKYSDWSDT